MADPTPEQFRAAMARFATGVAVMTTVDDGTPHAMTANAVSSVSLDPLLVLVCVERSTSMAEAVLNGGIFALSFLTAEQEPLSRYFASSDRPAGGEQFDGVPSREARTGALVLSDCLAYLDCEVWAAYDGGDHVIVVGRVVEAATEHDGDVLLYVGGRYGSTALGPARARG